MTRKPNGAPKQRAPSDDSSSVVLHARQTTFIMLIVTAIVAVANLAENVEGLNRALLEARTVVRLTELSKTKLEGYESVSLPRILAGPAPSSSKVREFVGLRLVPVDGGSNDDQVLCRIDVDLSEYHLRLRFGPVRYVRVVPSGRAGAQRVASPPSPLDRELWKHSPDYWYTRRPPENLVEFAALWNALYSSPRRAALTTDSLADQVGEGVVFTQGSLYTVQGSFSRKYKDPTDRQELFFASLTNYRFKTIEPITFTNGMPESLPNWDMDQRLKRWSNEGYHTLGSSFCLNADGRRDDRFLLVFPVTMEEEPFDWTSEWIERLGMQGLLSEDDLRTARGGVAGRFSETFPNLSDVIAEFGTRELESLPDLLRERLDKSGSSIEIAGIALPGNLLSSLGLFIILVVQAYAARHLAEAAARMGTSADGDPGAFQAWIMLYQGRFSSWTAYAIVAAPTLAAAAVLANLYYPFSFTTPFFWAGGVAVLLSLVLTIWSVRNLGRLRDAADHHRQAEETPGDNP